MVPKGFHVLIPGTCEYVTLHGKRDFADVIKDLEAKRLFSINHIDPKCNHKGPCKRQREESESEIWQRK